MKKATKKSSTQTAVIPFDTTPSNSNPDELIANIDRARSSSKWLVAVFHIDDEQLFLDRTAMNFPKADIDLACRLFVENLQQLKAS